MLSIQPRWINAYKLCDFKPVYGYLFSDLLTGFDFWGFGDLDVVYGDIASVMDQDAWNHDVISGHGHIAAGHFTLVANTQKMRNAFRRIPKWERLLEDEEFRSFDEWYFSKLFTRKRMWYPWEWKLIPYLGNAYFKEQYSTDLRPLKWIDGTQNFPTRWYWRNGHLTADGAGTREFLYLHFTHWQSSRHVKSDKAPWQLLEQVDQLGPGRPRAFSISAQGFLPA